MSNLTIENLSPTIQIEGMDSSAQQGVSERFNAQIKNEMESNGMSLPGEVQGPHSFGDLLEKSINQVNDYQQQADRAIKELVAGRNKNIHETMLTVERADLSLKLMTQVRNKVIDAYKEIMRMQA